MSENVCCSGGAIGADSAWGDWANSLGHSVVHFSFNGHKTKHNFGETIVLSENQLLQADSHLLKANKNLKRKWPVKNHHVASLLRRNYFQVAWSESLYAISHIDSVGQVAGGTAWAVQMMIDIHPGAPIFLFDQRVKQWYQWKGVWLPIVAIPRPSGVYAGIGSRDINEHGLNAIKSL